MSRSSDRSVGSGKVRLSYEGGRCTLTLDDHERRNALGAELRADLAEAVDAVAGDPDVRVLVVTGAGSSFCSGADVPAVFGDPERPVAAIRRDLYAVYDSFLRISALAVPTIAAVQGPAVGAGLNLAMVCDVRVAGPRATFAATFTRIGLHPGGGCTSFLVRAMGPERALALLLDGGAMRGPDTVQAGLAAVYAEDPLAEALSMADRWAALEPDLVRDVKTAVRTAARGDSAATLELEAWAQAFVRQVDSAAGVRGRLPDVTVRSTLTVADLGTRGEEWHRFTVPADLARAYRAVTGLTGDDPPRGLASVVGRLAYTRGRDMPPGGVLRELTLRTLGPPPVDGAYDVRVRADVLSERDGRKRVRVLVSLRAVVQSGAARRAGGRVHRADVRRQPGQHRAGRGRRGRCGRARVGHRGRRARPADARAREHVEVHRRGDAHLLRGFLERGGSRGPLAWWGRRAARAHRRDRAGGGWPRAGRAHGAPPAGPGVPVKALRAVMTVLEDLVVGDDWRTSLGIVVTLAVTALLAHQGVPAWWLPPLAVLALLAGTVWAARRRAATDGRPAAIRADRVNRG